MQGWDCYCVTPLLIPLGRTYLCKDTLCASLELVLGVGGEDAQPAVRVQVQDVPALPS
jgi:hypothetical protein